MSDPDYDEIDVLIDTDPIQTQPPWARNDRMSKQ